MAEKPTSRAGARSGGRPPYKPTIETRRIVEEMKFCGGSENTIARALGIDPDTLRKHFTDELADGHAQRRKEVVGLLFETARKHDPAQGGRKEDGGKRKRLRNSALRDERLRASTPATGFEVRTPHRGRCSSNPCNR